MTIIKTFCCIALVTLGILDVTRAASFRIYKGSLDNVFETPLEDADGLYENLDKTKNVTLYAAGYKNNLNGTAIHTMLSTFIESNNTNVVLLNWDKESQGYLPSIFGYGAAIEAAKRLAVTAAKTVVKLIGKGISENYFRLFGHSLGAHLMGWMGKEVQKSNYNLSIIWGLDPSGPAFETVIGLKGLSPSDAKTVCGIYTNSGQYGTSDAVAAINFWVNCNNGSRQPGCPDGIYLPLDPNGMCSHNRSWIIMSEALLNPDSFVAAQANTCNNWKSQNSSNVVTNILGDNVDRSKLGNFYLSTNSESPYSKGPAGISSN